MGYQMPIVVKEIVLPCQISKSLTAEQYKDEYGIDLRKIIEFDDSWHLLLKNSQNTKFYVSIVDGNFDAGFVPNLIPLMEISMEGEPNNVERYVLGIYSKTEDAFLGMALRVNKVTNDWTIQAIVY